MIEWPDNRPIQSSLEINYARACVRRVDGDRIVTETLRPSMVRLTVEGPEDAVGPYMHAVRQCYESRKSGEPERYHLNNIAKAVDLPREFREKYGPQTNALVEEAESRVFTNDVDALEALVVEGLPPDEMQAAAWVLIQRVRGLRADLMRLQLPREACAECGHVDWREWDVSESDNERDS